MTDLHAILAAQREAFMGALPVSIADRKDRLKRAAAMVSDNAAAFCDALSEDFGHRSREQSMLTDIAASVAPIRHAIKAVDGWAKRDKRPVQFPLGLLGARAWVEYQPKGVIGVIAPWNFPVQLVMAPLAGVFAAGNRAMVKTSEFTPSVAALFEQVVAKYFAPEELAFVSGGPEVGKAFASLPFDHLIFTGATSVGKHILHAAADNLVPVTLELGGKSPVIVGKGADIAQATERVALGKMLNAGQICLAPDYVLVEESQEAAVVDGLRAAASAMYPTLLSNPDYTSVVNDRHFQRLTDLIDDARAKGATIEVVNPGGEDFGASNARKMPLHIVTDVNDDMAIMQEEIFGPLLPVRRYSGIDDAIGQVNRRDRPLGLYYFGGDDGERRRVLDRTISGGVTVDDVIFHVSMEDLPFGGVGPSGMGSYHGRDGFMTFSHAKAVFKQAKFDVAKLAGLKPPYGKEDDGEREAADGVTGVDGVGLAGSWALVPHPDYPPVVVRTVRVDVAVTADGWRLDYRVEGAGGVLLPERAAGTRTDGLWKTTCFELFVRADDAAGYSEFNFSPSGDWAAYRFDEYREGMRDLALATAPDVRGASVGDRYGLEVALAADGLAPDVARIGLSAVIEEAGAKSFWALNHAAGAPDFHNRDCFTARLAAPEAL